MEWSTLMAGPWGEHDEKSIKIKKELLIRYDKEWHEWKAKRIAAGKWLTLKVNRE